MNSEKKIESLDEPSVSEKLYFSEKETDRLRMVCRAAKTEVNTLWQTICLHQETIRQHEEAMWQVPWDIVRVWYFVRRAIPTPVLRMIDQIRKLLRRNHAN